MRKVVSTITMALVMMSTLSIAFDDARIRSLSPSYWYVDWRYPIYGTHRWISDAINDPRVLDGDIIRVMWGAEAIPYIERVNVTKSVTIEGYDGRPIIDGGGKGAVFNVIKSNVILSNLRIRNGEYGIALSSSATWSNVTNNSVTNVKYGISVGSKNNTIVGNTLTANEFGISISSIGNFLRGNNMTNNLYNFGIKGRFTENVVQSELLLSCGVITFNGWHNIFYHNNIKYNHNQVVIEDSFEYWDNGAEGNYWSDYLLQNPQAKDENHDGIWDSPYKINDWNYDDFPLVLPWKSIRIFNVAKTEPSSVFPGYNVTFHSDHVIASLNFTRIGIESYPRELSFFVTAGSSGFCNITIPRYWLDGPFILWVNNVPRSFDILTQNASHSSLYFTYIAGAHQVKIIGTKSGAILGDITGPNGVPDGKIDMYDIGRVARGFSEHLPSNLTPEDVTEYDP
jgi:parallel beta-helix repeat protein